MRRGLRHSVGAVAWIAALLLFSVGAAAQSIHRPAVKRRCALKKFLQGYVGLADDDENSAVRYFLPFVNLNRDGAQEAIVYLMNGGWCGSGGCTTLVLAPRGDSYRIVGKFTIAWPPIRALAAKSHGWHDIAVQMHGGGIRPYEAVFSFNGERYPDEPSPPPSRPVTKRAPGKVVVPSAAFEQGKRLYP